MGDGGIDMRFLPVFRAFIFWGGVSVGDAGVVDVAKRKALGRSAFSGNEKVEFPVAFQEESCDDLFLLET